MDDSLRNDRRPVPWNKGKLIGQKLPLKQQEIWRIRANLEHERNLRELAMFDLAIDSKLRACDLTALRVRDAMRGDQITERAVVLQHKTQHPVRFEITDIARQALAVWTKRAGLQADDFLFPSRCKKATHLSTRQYARIVGRWVTSIQLDRSAYLLPHGQFARRAAAARTQENRKHSAVSRRRSG
jgi:integrase